MSDSFAVVIRGSAFARSVPARSGHCITWSARISNDCGIDTPIALAVLRLIISSTSVGRFHFPDACVDRLYLCDAQRGVNLRLVQRALILEQEANPAYARGCGKQQRQILVAEIAQHIGIGQPEVCA